MILRELTGHTRHRRIAVDLLILQALDWDEGELLDEHSARSGGPTSEVRSTVPGLLRTTSAELLGGEPSAINRQELTREVEEWGRRGAARQRSTTVNHGAQRTTNPPARQL
ncbi:MAG TPA: hypothetical protein VFC13_26120 [Actinomycetes bacterium]|nr:hypothetical protein [Actinomycetes bacterium]